MLSATFVEDVGDVYHGYLMPKSKDEAEGFLSDDGNRGLSVEPRKLNQPL